MAGHRVALTRRRLPSQRLTAQAQPNRSRFHVHVLFCVSCPYCDFVVYAGRAARGPTSRINTLVEALLTEIDLRADTVAAAVPAPVPLTSVYLGGGTPSLLPVASIAAILDRVAARFGIAAGAEVTLEATPGPDERGDAAGWRDAGVADPSAPRARPAAPPAGQRHRPADVVTRSAGTRGDQVGQPRPPVRRPARRSSHGRDAEAALALSPTTSPYALTLDDPDAEGLTGAGGDHLPTTAGARRWRAEARPQQDEDRAAAQYHHAVHRLAEDGWRGYEISNWARPHEPPQPHLLERRPYEAVGPGPTHSSGTVRRWNAARLDGYLAALRPADGSAPRLPPGGSEMVDAAAAAAETAILALRLDTGLPVAAADDPALARTLRWARDLGLVRRTDDDRLVLTTEGRLLSNEVFGLLLPEPSR
jgi:oxygen-independent coproporphyrinogen-3 oxidase